MRQGAQSWFWRGYWRDDDANPTWGLAWGCNQGKAKQGGGRCVCVCVWRVGVGFGSVSKGGDSNTATDGATLRSPGEEERERKMQETNVLSISFRQGAKQPSRAAHG
jgi:hypothetical protein